MSAEYNTRVSADGDRPVMGVSWKWFGEESPDQYHRAYCLGRRTTSAHLRLRAGRNPVDPSYLPDKGCSGVLVGRLSRRGYESADQVVDRSSTEDVLTRT